VRASDPEGYVVTLQILNLPLPTYITNSGFAFTINPLISQPADTFTVQYRVFDGQDYSLNADFTVIVTPTSAPLNQPPILTTGIPDFTMSAEAAKVSKTVVASDPES
jgi:hypothetical protein